MNRILIALDYFKMKKDNTPTSFVITIPLITIDNYLLFFIEVIWWIRLNLTVILKKTKQQFGKETDENINEDEMVGVSAQNVMAKRLLAM